MEQLSSFIKSKADKVCNELKKEYLIFKESGNEKKLRDFQFGFASANGVFTHETDEGIHYHPNASFKYVRNPESHINKNIPYVNYISELLKDFDPCLFEIGVGPGYLFYLLKNNLNVKIYGCDVLIDKIEVYKRIRRELKIENLVEEQAIIFNKPFRINKETNVILAFWTVFNKSWGREEHIWFLKECAKSTSGEKKFLILRFNLDGYSNKDDVKKLYHQIGNYPLKDDPLFCTIDLTQKF